MGDNNYTLIRKVNLKKSGFSNKKFEITFDGIKENVNVGNTENYFTVNHDKKNYCFLNPLVYVLFQKYRNNITDDNKVKIDITKDINTGSNNILINFTNFDYNNYTAPKFGFKGNDNKFIPITPHLFSGFIDDSLKRYALILLEKYYNDNNNKNEQDKIERLCMTSIVSGGGKKRHNRTKKSD